MTLYEFTIRLNTITEYMKVISFLEEQTIMTVEYDVDRERNFNGSTTWIVKVGQFQTVDLDMTPVFEGITSLLKT